MNMLAQILKQQRQAAVYVAVALEVIPLAKSADDLRTWWNEEQQHSGEYDLTEAQADFLIGACREHVRRLGETRGVQP
ncbi:MULTISPECIES: hypothetical protein [unclassified Bradyrhizobium]|jgi:hypothetical protein|uniref:hypothetical protein n=1 Tax=unclassified Bradyrhizobium TaxID=2631580 RepID=UPI001FF8E1CF|nr:MULTISPECIES: hypothetical protein [unclassified Bradyrhizobium]MCK1589127.1 hypothetical protein [Bradyrhizobium sp. 169]MCK1663337.1 hypothetical protein [Bradyrhizobium sp. 151]